jgi:CHAD domain-containing protein
MTMSRLPTPASKSVPLRKSGPRSHPLPQLNVAVRCDTAFRIVARRHFASLGTNREATCEGDPIALHQMRAALTHLRTSILFFSPMVDDAITERIRDELKWLNSELGAVRDLDVAIERIAAANPKLSQARPHFQSWQEKRAEGHRQLTHSLRSARYRRLVERTSGWIENGPWCTKTAKQAARRRATPIAAYSLDKLAQWEEKLLKKCRKLRSMGAKKRHRLRLLNKKLTCSIDSLADLFSDKRFSKQQTALKHLRKAQRCLGQLNDDVRGPALAAALRQDGVETSLEFLTPKDRKRLLSATEEAYQKLAALKAWK